MVSIIIPVVDCEEYTEQCLSSIKRNTKDYELVIIDNGSKIPFTPDNDWIDVSSFGSSNKSYYVSNREGIGSLTVIRNEENLGFPKAVNQGIKIASGEYICILNNDIIVTKDWLEHLLWHLNNGLDIVGPMSNSISGYQQVTIGSYDNEEEFNVEANKFYEANKHQVIYYSTLIGFCMLMKREVIDEVGLFDEHFGLGNFEDIDFDIRAIEKGFKLGIAKDVYLHHFCSVTHKSLCLDYEELFNRNQDYFKTKWSDEIYKQLIEKGENYGRGKS